MILDPEDKRRIKLICLIFNAQSVFIDGVRVNVPKEKEESPHGSKS